MTRTGRGGAQAGRGSAARRTQRASGRHPGWKHALCRPWRSEGAFAGSLSGSGRGTAGRRRAGAEKARARGRGKGAPAGGSARSRGRQRRQRAALFFRVGDGGAAGAGSASAAIAGLRAAGPGPGERGGAGEGRGLGKRGVQAPCEPEAWEGRRTAREGPRSVSSCVDGKERVGALGSRIPAEGEGTRRQPCRCKSRSSGGQRRSCGGRFGSMTR